MDEIAKFYMNWDYDSHADHFSFFAEDDGLKADLFRVDFTHAVPEADHPAILDLIKAVPAMRKALQDVDDRIQALLDSEDAGISRDAAKDLQELQLIIALATPT